MNKKSIILSLLMILLFIGGVIVFTPSKTVLSISSRKNPKLRVYSSEACSKGFIISYTHSVNKGRIHDFYKCNETDNKFVHKCTHFVSYGAGIPDLEEIPGASFVALDDCYIIKNINRELPELVMAVGTIANHSFAIAGPEYKSDCENDFENIKGEIFLADYFLPQTSLIFKIEKVSIAGYLVHKIN